ncbi:cytochrome P450 [Rubrivivax sp. RP6-9]|uniref:cytochrome P450 n=1 Tax=Rubrivivax sp. RP6-9 TaxID=3415750 RepID=UPI003CC68B04
MLATEPADWTAHRYDPLDAGVMCDPYPHYARLREAAPLCWVRPAAMGITRYDDVVKLVKSGRIASSFPEHDPRFALGDGPAAELTKHVLLMREVQDHQRLRSLLAPAFSPQRLVTLQQRIDDHVDAMLDRAIDNGGFDAVSDLALPLTVAVVCDLLGIDRELQREIGLRSRQLSQAFAPFAMPQEGRSAASESLAWLRELVGRLIDERMHAPRGDLLSEFAAALQVDSGCSREELVDNAVFVVFTGYETTSSLIGTGFSMLLDHEAECRRLWDNPHLVKSAVHEMMRFDAPSQFAAGVARDAVDFHGHRIKPGRVVFFMLGSANRDPRKFDRPDQFDIAREHNPHLSFGLGAHYCVGAALAMMECHAVFLRALHRLRSIEPRGQALRLPNPSIRSFSSVPVAVLPR